MNKKAVILNIKCHSLDFGTYKLSRYFIR